MMPKITPRQFLAKMKYVLPVLEVLDCELDAIKRCQIILELGFEVTHEMIERELKITREANARFNIKVCSMR